MKRRASPTRIGLFVIVGLALLAAAVVTVSGNRLFASNERAVMHFSGSIYGLQLGAPVVFRGVRLGSVVSIGVEHDAASGRFAIPVVAELDRNLIREVQGAGATSGTQHKALSLATLVAQGLSAQLSTQSLLTGLLYVDLDLRPGAVPTASVPPAGPRADGMVEIPTLAAPIQALMKQVENVNFGQLMSDVSSIAASTRQFLGGAKLQQTLDDIAQVAADLKRLTARLDQRLDPLANAVQGTLADTRRMAGQLGSAAERVSASADRVGASADKVAGTAGNVDTLLANSAPLLQSLQRAADELGRSAASLRAATAEDSSLLLNVDRATQDVSRASRAVRELADLLERQPDALIRGRGAAAP
jgi:paraquat-inducible protein B